MVRNASRRSSEVVAILQVTARSTGAAGDRPALAPHQPRRAAAALVGLKRRDEPGRSKTISRLSFTAFFLRFPHTANARFAGVDGPVANLRPRRWRRGSSRNLRYLLHPQLVAMDGFIHPGAHR